MQRSLQQAVDTGPRLSSGGQTPRYFTQADMQDEFLIRWVKGTRPDFSLRRLLLRLNLSFRQRRARCMRCIVINFAAGEGTQGARVAGLPPVRVGGCMPDATAQLSDFTTRQLIPAPVPTTSQQPSRVEI